MQKRRTMSSDTLVPCEEEDEEEDEREGEEGVGVIGEAVSWKVTSTGGVKSVGTSGTLGVGGTTWGGWANGCKRREV